MPLLKPEDNQYPPLLLEEPATPEFLGQRTWWAVYTLSRQEKALMRVLLAKEIPFYCPMAENQYRSPAGRRRVSYLPLFSNYVFVRGTEEQRHAALASNKVSKCLPVLEPVEFVEQMRVIWRLIAASRPITIESTWTTGMRVRVKSGPLEGAEGVISERRGGRYWLVEVTILKRLVSVQLEDWDLERL